MVRLSAPQLGCVFREPKALFDRVPNLGRREVPIIIFFHLIVLLRMEIVRVRPETVQVLREVSQNLRTVGRRVNELDLSELRVRHMLLSITLHTIVREVAMHGRVRVRQPKVHSDSSVDHLQKRALEIEREDFSPW